MMDSYDEYYQRICRVCLSYRNNENMVCLTDVNSEDGLSFYGKAVEKFANVSIKISDDLPQSMCQNCLLMLKQAIHFKFKCESSDEDLAKLYRQHIEYDSNIREIVVDFCLFRDNFPQAFSHNKSSSNSENKSQCTSEEMVRNSDSNGEESSYENEDNLDDIDLNSADEILDQIEKHILRNPKLAKDDYKLISKKKVHQNKTNTSQQKAQQSKQNTITTKTEKHVCTVCQKELANPHTLRHHMQMHEGFDFICEQCGKGFPLLVGLQMHQVTVHGIGPSLQCPHCPYKTLRRFTLTEHIRLHTGERPYTCDKCGLTFRRRAIWTKHMIYHQEKTVQCPHCPRKFHRLVEMQAHSNGVHERMYVFLCHKCDTTYAKISTVRRHLTERHGIPREMQGKITRINKGKGIGFPEP